MAGKRAWVKWQNGDMQHQKTEEGESSEELMREKQGEDGEVAAARRRLGSREAWEFG